MFIVGQICDELTFRVLQFSITTLKWHRLQAMFTWLFDYQIKYRNWFSVEQSTTPIAKHILEENITLCLHSRIMHLQTDNWKTALLRAVILGSKSHQPIIPWTGTNDRSSNSESFVPFWYAGTGERKLTL